MKGFETMKYILDELCIEVTRRCNMNCAHCLRGEAQNIDIDTKYIDKLLEDVTEIGSITFTGGEPSLNIQAIDYTLERCKDLGIYVGSFYLVTNGKENTLPLAIASLRWYAYCDRYDMDEGIGGIALSKDMFHDEIDAEHEGILRGLSFFREDKFTDFNNVRIINEGRAEELYGFSKTDVSRHSEGLSFDLYDDECRIESMIYLSANGDIRNNCNVAYNDDDYTMGNLRKHTFDYLMQELMNEHMVACA